MTPALLELILQHKYCCVHRLEGAPNLDSSDAMEPPGTYSRKMLRQSLERSVPCKDHVSLKVFHLGGSCEPEVSPSLV